MSCTFLRDDLGCELHAIAVDPRVRFPGSRAACRHADRPGAARGRDRRRHRVRPGSGRDRLAIVDETGVCSTTTTCWRWSSTAPCLVFTGRGRQPHHVVGHRRHRARAGPARHRTPVGEANVVEMMEAVGAAIGGEGSNGGVICRQVHLCRDSFAAMALVLDRVAATGLRVSQLAAKLLDTCVAKGRCPSSTVAWVGSCSSWSRRCRRPKPTRAMA